MNQRYRSIAAAAAMTLALAMPAGIAWSIIPSGKRITGEITAPPNSSQIEVEHQLYKIKADSQAAQSVGEFHSGQIVDVILDRETSSKVVAINKHPGT
jgi:hypothetical protein